MMPQPFEDAPSQPDTTQPTPECPKDASAPQDGVQQWSAPYANPNWAPKPDTDAWSSGYAAARRFYGDTAPLALDKIRARLDHFRIHQCGGTIPDSSLTPLFADLTAILDTAQETR